MIWFYAVIDTTLLIFLTSIISLSIGTITALFAWASNKTWAFFLPILTLAVPPWLISYYMSDIFGYVDPWLGASLSLGIACSVYSHAIIASSLANRAYRNWEMIQVSSGPTLKNLATVVYPSIKISMLPSIAIISAEVISDFGVANFYGLNTLTMLTYNIWSGTWMFELLVPGLVLLVIMSFLVSRLDVRNFTDLTMTRSFQQNTLLGIVALIPTLLLILSSFIISILWIANDDAMRFFSNDLLQEFFNSMLLIVTVVIVCFATIALYFVSAPLKNFLRRTGIMTYAMPGTVVGATILYLFAGVLPMIIMLILAIAIRYFGLAIHSVSVAESSSSKYLEVIDFYTHSKLKRIVQKFQLIIPSITIGMSLIVLDVLRELPISIILQPYNFTTLATRMNYIARTEYIPGIGPQSLIILVLGIIFATIIVRMMNVKNSKP